MDIPVSREIASALARLVAEGQGATHSELSSIFRAAGFQDADPFDPVTRRCNKHTRVLAVMRAAQRRPAYATQLVSDLLRTLYLAGGLTEPATPPVAVLSAELEHAGWQLTSTGRLDRL